MSRGMVFATGCALGLLAGSPAFAGFSDNLGGYHGMRPGGPASEVLENDPYSHNGSDVTIEAQGHSMKIYYERPKSGLARSGIRKNTILFVGTIYGRNVEGTAYVFKLNCDPAPYQVKGRFDRSQNLLLEGAAPIRDSQSCAVIGYGKSGNSRLFFQEAFGDI